MKLLKPTYANFTINRLELDGYSMFDVSLEPAHPRYKYVLLRMPFSIQELTLAFG